MMSSIKKLLKHYLHFHWLSYLVSFLFSPAVFLFCILILCVPLTQAQLRAAAVKEDITPSGLSIPSWLW